AIVRAEAQLVPDPALQEQTAYVLAHLSLVRGRLADAERHAQTALDLSEQRGLPGSSVGYAVMLAMIELHYRNAPDAARRGVEEALRRHPLASIPAADRPYPLLAWFYAEAGQPERAREVLAEYDASVPDAFRRRQPLRTAAAAAGGLAEGQVQDAISAYRTWYAEDNCAVCGLFELGRAYERAGEGDSAIAVYERAVATPGLVRLFEEAPTLAATYRNLGELYEERGDRDKARDYYGRVLSPRKNADGEPQRRARAVARRRERRRRGARGDRGAG